MFEMRSGIRMDIHKKITIKISPNELKDIIIDYLIEHGYNVMDSDINFHVSTHLEGYGVGEHEVKSFDGCSVNINMCTVNQTRI